MALEMTGVSSGLNTNIEHSGMQCNAGGSIDFEVPVK